MKNIKKTILITGGSGFIGQNLRNIDVTKYNTLYLSYKKKIKNVKKDKIVNINNIFNKVKKIDFIIHLAGSDDFYIKKGIKNNNIKLDKLIKKLVDHFSIKKIVFASSNRVYEGNKKNYISENSIVKPISVYAKSKLNTEKILKKMKCKIIILRLPSVISKDFSKGLIFRVIRTLKKNKNLKIFNSQLPFNNIIFLENLIKIIIYSINFIERKKTIINIAAVNPVKFINVIKYLVKMTKSKSKIIEDDSKSSLKHYSTKFQNQLYKFKIFTVKNSLKKLFYRVKS